MIKDKRVAFVFRASSLLFAVLGILAMLGVFRGNLWLSTFAFYTMQSNLLAVVLFAMLLVKTIGGLRDGATGNAGYFARFEMVCTINVLLTFVVYWVLLAPTIFSMVEGYSLWTFDNIAVHAITPLLCLFDYILFTSPRHLKYRDIYCVCIFPLAYLAVSSIAGLLGYVYFTSASDGLPVRFPYFFYDFDRIGIASLAYIGGLILFFIIIGHIFYLYDRKRRI